MSSSVAESTGQRVHKLEVHCESMSVSVGRHLADDLLETSRQAHQIAAPCVNASLLLEFGNAAGQGEQIRVSDRHVAVIPADRLETVESQAQFLATVISIPQAFVGAMARANGMRGFVMAAQYASVDPFLWHMARSIERQVKAHQALDQAYIESLAIVIGQHLLDNYAQASMTVGALGGLPSYKVKRAIEYVRSHYREDIGFKDIADELRMSPFHFARMFKHSTSESPQQFIMRCRIDAAKRLLVETDRNIADIALEVGYKSQSYFTTRFAQLVGMTPAAFRSAN